MLRIWQAALAHSLIIVLIASITLLFIVSDLSGALCGLTLLMLAGSAGFLGTQYDTAPWYKTAFWLILGAIYAFWQWNLALDSEWILALAAWYSMHSALLLLGLSILEQRSLSTKELCVALTALIATIPWLLALTVALIMLGIWTVCFSILPARELQHWWFYSSVQHFATGMTLLLLSAWSALQIWWGARQERYIYMLALWITLLLCYIRLLILGLAAFTHWDSAGLLGMALIAFFFHQFSSARPWYYLTLLLPLLALMIPPWQLASTWCAATLLTSGIIYLSLASAMRQPWPLYFGVLAVNGAVYLWIPQWAQHYGLWQFYLIPAALSALVVLHLHRRELRHSLLHNGRLAALSILYAGAGLDVFLRPELWIFILALVLGLAGVILGLTLRIRAFLYTGTTFIILNICGQLRYFYPQHNMSKALILLLLGALITAGMVLFHIKREILLQRIRIVRADLIHWE